MTDSLQLPSAGEPAAITNLVGQTQGNFLAKAGTVIDWWVEGYVKVECKIERIYVGERDNHLSHWSASCRLGLTFWHR
ncbi:MAG: hypothetical protein ACR2PT_23780 [Endozoicomonas sp.]